jgi:hypothetical protein
MPLIKSKSDKAFKSNIKAEVAAGKPVKQAVAIAYSTKRAAKKARGGSMSPHDYDSDWDYYRATGQMDDDEDEKDEEQPSRRSIMAEQKRKEKSAKKNSANWQASEMYRPTDRAEASRQFNRLSRRKESNSLLDRVKRLSKNDDAVSGLGAKMLRKQWSEKIGGGKPAPFKSGGKAKVCW